MCCSVQSFDVIFSVIFIESMGDNKEQFVVAQHILSELWNHNHTTKLGDRRKSNRVLFSRSHSVQCRTSTTLCNIIIQHYL